jgi:exopolysaccharide biosynthesis polyprenyl glycosylphosphotransferase
MATEADELQRELSAPTLSAASHHHLPTPRRVWLRRILVSIDAGGFLLAWAAVSAFSGSGASTVSMPIRVAETGAIIASGIILASAQGLYRTSVNAMRAVAYMRLMRAALGSACVAFLVSARMETNPSVIQPALGAVLAFVLAAIGRYVFDYWLEKARANGRYMRRVILVGSADEIRGFVGYLLNNPELGYEPCGAVGSTHDETLPIPWLGPAGMALEAARVTGASGAIVVANGLAADELNGVIRHLGDAGIHVHLSSGLLGFNYRRLRAVPVGHEPFLYVEPTSLSRVQVGAKRACDVVFSLIGLVVAAPVLAIAAIAIKLEDRGPVLFRQVRVGRDGKPITVHKLRTMCVDAEARFDEVRHLNERTGPLFKTEADPRVTRVGHILRASSIDELAQLMDVLRGHMSLVGPRPALPAEVAEFDHKLLGRLRMKPGITGLWQVEKRDDPSLDAYQRLDLFYVENWSLLLDLAIMLNTAPAVLDRAIGAMRRQRSVSVDTAEVVPLAPAAVPAGER